MLFRFLLAILRARRRPRLAVLAEDVTAYRCWPADCDANFHMNDGRFVSVSGLARVALMIRIGLGAPFRRLGWRPVASASEVRYFREIRPLSRFTIRTRIVAWDEKYFFFEHLFERPGRDGAVLLARILVRSVFRGPSGPVPTRLVLSELGFSGAAPETSEEVRHWMALSDLVRKRKSTER
jgi:acyl-CoA thioesterase FadM